ncbi:MAG TPA: hypothetical protein VI408_00080 [Gaiellaceae bacterium]
MPFPIVLSNGPPPDGLARVADAGVTMVRTGRATWSDAAVGEERALLDAAAARGLQCWVWLGGLQDLPAGAPSPQRDLLTHVVDQLHTHPALGAWKGHDEPNLGNVPPANLERGLRAIKSVDDTHPVVVVMAPRGTPQSLVRYRKSVDVAGVDVYPVSYPPGVHSSLPAKDVGVVGDQARWLRAGVGTKPFWLTLQIAWSGILPPHVPRFPSSAELRFMAYQAIAAGARGLVFFGGHLTQVMSPADAAAGWNWSFWTQSLEPLVRQLSSTALAPALDAPAGVKVQASVKDVEIATRRTAQFDYLIAVRRGNATSRVQFTGLPSTLRGGQVLFEYANGAFRSVGVSGGAFTDWFGPRDARVYRFTRQTG